ncbi:MAG: porphobilinogen synthase [Phycisphaera sp.]|nr:porphobilinogen synthase [Phycisphaera sp.]
MASKRPTKPSQSPVPATLDRRAHPKPYSPIRPRRLRRGIPLRDAVADVRLHPQDLIYPMFIHPGDRAIPVASMPGVSQLPVKGAMNLIRDLSKAGLTQFIFFGVTPPEMKDGTGSYARHPDAPVNRLTKAVRDAGLDVVVYNDLCFCEYTDHGHCGALDSHDHAMVVANDATLELLGQTAVAQAQAGADVVAPSGMMDHMVAAIRQALDAAGFENVAILSYSVKYASNFYGPFRDAGQGHIAGGGDRKSYQMDYRRSREWRTELEADIAEGADMVMVKPAVPYLDILSQMRRVTSLPLAAYHVSGEYAMLHAAAEKGWLDLKNTAIETTIAIKRAGADLILTYFAPKLVEWLG